MKVILVDDDQKFHKSFERYAKKCDEITTACLFPTELGALTQAVRAESATDPEAVLLLDYRLDQEATPTQDVACYRAPTVAGQLRETLPQLPIVLITAESNFGLWISRSSTLRDVFDHQLLKSDLRRSYASVFARLRGIARGYRLVAEVFSQDKSPRERIVSLTQCSDVEMRSLAMTFHGEAPASPPEVVRWLLKEVLQYPGPLLNEVEVAARLGISRESLRDADVQRFLESIRYRGAFAEAHERWWNGRLSRQVASMEGHICDNLAQGASRAYCSWCGGGSTDFACAKCGCATESSHSLCAQMDPRPRWADDAMVCFDCIQKGQAEGVTFPPGSSPIVAAIEFGKVRRT